jgi:hypothetical protein
MGSGLELCGRCGRLTEDSARDKAIGSSSAYCSGCMMELREELQGRNICSLCRCAIWDDDPKFVMPSRIYSRYFFDRLPIGNRLMCASCHRGAERLGAMGDPLAKLGSIRSRLGKIKQKGRGTEKRVADGGNLL